MAHNFSVGQIVELTPRVLRAAAEGQYEILHLVPAPEGDPDDPRYRVKSVSEKHERIVPQSELTLSEEVHA